MGDLQQITAVKLDYTFEKSKLDWLMSYISIEKRNRINNFHRYDDALRTLIGDILIRYSLCQMLKIKNKELIFEINKYGKPFLSKYNDVKYNISHSGEWVVCYIDNLPVGIDIELIKPIDVSIVERFFSEEEVKSLLSKSTIEREAYFYNLWTLKESYIKAIGKGLSIPLDSFTIKIGEGKITACSVYELSNYYFRQYYIDENYKMAVCSAKDEFPNSVHIVDINELYEQVLQL